MAINKMIMIRSLTKNKQDVYVRADDMLKTLYSDLANTSTEVREYIQSSINVWEEYINSTIDNANKR
jgi:hypothetical protein